MEFAAIPLVKLNAFCNFYGVSIDYVCGLTDTKKYKLGKFLMHTYPLIDLLNIIKYLSIGYA